jgi:TRAP-type C4-dicarboxylate transport system permease small subunit
MRRITVSTVLKWVVTANEWGAVISSLVVVLAIFTQVVLRYIFHHPLLGMEEIAIMAVLWLWFLAIALASERGFHISGGLPVTRQSIRDIMVVVYPFICLLVTVIFGYLCYLYCVWVVEGHVISGGLFIPWIWTVSGAFLGLVLNAVFLTWEAVAKLRTFRRARQRGSQ